MQYTILIWSDGRTGNDLKSNITVADEMQWSFCDERWVRWFTLFYLIMYPSILLDYVSLLIVLLSIQNKALLLLFSEHLCRLEPPSTVSVWYLSLSRPLLPRAPQNDIAHFVLPVNPSGPFRNISLFLIIGGWMPTTRTCMLGSQGKYATRQPLLATL